MRALSRLAEPDILARKKAQWTQAFINSGNTRPNSSQYGHNDVKVLLYAMSRFKCFYCERPLKNNSKEIDHFIEVAEKKNLSFEWSNLYLACDNCNGKIPNKTIPVTSVLDPCSSTDAQIESAFYYEDEQIKEIPGSSIGDISIRKYKLDSDLLDRVRAKHLIHFLKTYNKIKDDHANQGRNTCNADELQTILAFASPSSPFSLMFRLLLRSKGFPV